MAKKRKKKLKGWVKSFLSFLLLLILAFIGFYIMNNYNLEDSDNEKEKEPTSEVNSESDKNETQESPIPTFDYDSFLMEELNQKLTNFTSTSAILVEKETGNVLYFKNPDKKIYPASITKVMTVLVALENLNSLNEQVKLSTVNFDELELYEASVAGYSYSDVASAKDLLYATMLPSGADAAIAISNHIAGSEEGMVSLMNEKLVELGITDTHFTNVTGLHYYDHYSTVSDLAKILIYALKNENFREIFTTEKYTTSPTVLNKNGLELNSTVLSRIDDSYSWGMILGGKTGFTNQAGLCLASLASDKTKEYVAITVGSTGTPRENPNHIKDTINLYQTFLTKETNE